MADGAASSRPIDPAKRIDAIDALRGIALFGVLAMNLVMGFRVSWLWRTLMYGEAQPMLRVRIEAVR